MRGCVYFFLDKFNKYFGFFQMFLENEEYSGGSIYINDFIYCNEYQDRLKEGRLRKIFRRLGFINSIFLLIQLRFDLWEIQILGFGLQFNREYQMDKRKGRGENYSLKI